MSKDSSLTPRQQTWVEHLRQWAARGQSLSGCAAEQRLKVSSLYEAKAQARVVAGACMQFVRVHPVRPVEAVQLPPLFRVSLPNGVVVEAAGGELSAVLSAGVYL